MMRIRPKTLMWLALMAAVMISTGCGQVVMKVAAWKLDLPQPGYGVVVDEDVRVPMDDGIFLAADVYRPDAPGEFPVVLCRTPYGKNLAAHKYDLAGKLFASQGFVFVCQDVRGKHGSQGEYYPYIYEPQDGVDTIAWVARQPWSNGKVGTYGFSYWGSTQWLSAPLNSPHLKAMVPIVTGQNLYRRWIYNGVFRINDVLVWHWQNAHRTMRSAEAVNAMDWDKAIRHLPLMEADNAIGEDIPAYNDWIAHPQPSPYWERINVDNQVSQITAPALIIDGWYDYYLDWAIEDFVRMRTEGSGDARKSRLIIGPWTHNSRSEFDAVDFGEEAGFMKRIGDIFAWHRHWLNDEISSLNEGGPVKIFVMGINQWRTENEWPLARTRFTKYYLHSGGNAGSPDGDGRLSVALPSTGPVDRYIYDPADPTPNIGGTTIYGNQIAGPTDQRPLYDRKDVLYFSTPPMEQDLEVTGPLTLVLHAASTAKDTDFAATVVDVNPDGRAINLKTGLVRARFRESLLEPSFLERGKIYPFEVKIGNTSNVFKKGHRLRIQLASAHFPEYGRNLNTGAPIGCTAETVPAEQTIYHDQDHPSHLLVPVIPASEGR